MIFPLASITLDKDLLVGVGVIFTAVIGLWNLGYSFRHNRRASYVNSVTITRLKWIGDVRDHLSRFAALICESAVAPANDPSERHRIFSEIAYHRMLLRLQLAPEAASLDEHFEREIESLFRDADSLMPKEIEDRLEILVKIGQKFLWEEWLKVKSEAIYGDPYDTLRKRLFRWFERADG